MFKNQILLLLFIGISSALYAQSKTIHVYVALCDNKYQGIAPVPKTIGDGQNPKNNLYWGAGYGIKTFFSNKTKDWKLIETIKSDNPHILERLLFKHTTQNVYLLADAYDGRKIKPCTEDFLKASNRQNVLNIKHKSKSLQFGGKSDLLAYIGHNGLMDFYVNVKFYDFNEESSDVIILACYSKKYFSPKIKKAKANPVLWTTHLMAPEAYTLKAAIDGWLLNETGSQIKERAAQEYNKYQKCGIKGARNLFTTGLNN